MELREYQERAINLCRASHARGHKRIILVMPTGSGKTPTALSIVKSARDKGRRTLFLADRRQLVNQASQRATEWEVKHGILMDGYTPDLTHSLQIGSKDTIYARVFKSSRLELPRFDLIVVDEAHKMQNPSALANIEANPDAYVLGITATAAGVNGKGLGDTYSDLIIGATYKELHDGGFLVANEVFAPTLPDLSKCKTNADGDFVQVQAEKVMLDKKIVGDVWEHWKRLGQRRPTVVFATGVAHSIELRDMFRARGVAAEHIDGETPDQERDEYYDAFKAGYVNVLSNYGVLDTGWDAPWCSCAVIVRPTKSRVLWMQMCGRVGRPWPGKLDSIIIDHGGNVYRHGYPDEDIPWTLDSGKKIEQVVTDWRTNGGERDPICCPKCHRYRERGNVCAYCGHRSQRRGKGIEHVDGELEHVDRTAKSVASDVEDLGKQWRKCLAIAAHRGSTCASARAHFYKLTKRWVDESLAVSPRPKDHEWKMIVGDLYPGFVRRKKVHA